MTQVMNEEQAHILCWKAVREVSGWLFVHKYRNLYVGFDAGQSPLEGFNCTLELRWWSGRINVYRDAAQKNRIGTARTFVGLVRILRQIKLAALEIAAP